MDTVGIGRSAEAESGGRAPGLERSERDRTLRYGNGDGRCGHAPCHVFHWESRVELSVPIDYQSQQGRRGIVLDDLRAAVWLEDLSHFHSRSAQDAAGEL